VARTHFLGQAKRGLVRLRGESLPGGASVVGADGRGLGTIVASAAGEALAVLSSERPAGLLVEGRPVEEAPLLSGLRRPL
jgi:folate-binding Fe-S cluster repair protein YgfZ